MVNAEGVTNKISQYYGRAYQLTTQFERTQGTTQLTQFHNEQLNVV